MQRTRIKKIKIRNKNNELKNWTKLKSRISAQLVQADLPEDASLEWQKSLQISSRKRRELQTKRGWGKKPDIYVQQSFITSPPLCKIKLSLILKFHRLIETKRTI